jgi:hypothetical protein
VTEKITKTDDEQPVPDTMVEALLHEREGYVQRGLDDRVAQVDEQLKLRGAEPPKQAKAAGRGQQQTRD